MSNSAYRAPALLPQDRHRGPRTTCPVCATGKSEYFRKGPTYVGRFCTASARLSLGWLRRCSEPGDHLHQKCETCGATWLCDPLEEP